ncbi:hypothetical protein [Aliihoeflea sp. PC F10.4]
MGEILLIGATGALALALLVRAFARWRGSDMRGEERFLENPDHWGRQ